MRAITIAAFAILAIELLRTAWVCDDAYITYRTADNIVRGLGPHPCARALRICQLIQNIMTALRARLGARDAMGPKLAWTRHPRETLQGGGAVLFSNCRRPTSGSQ